MEILFDKDTSPFKTKCLEGWNSQSALRPSIGSRVRQPFVSRSQWCVSYKILSFIENRSQWIENCLQVAGLNRYQIFIMED